MAQLTVYIGTNSQASYDPAPPVVRHGDTVTFVLVGRSDTVTVSFGSDSPFSQAEIGLSSISNQSMTVASDAAPKKYPFTATPVKSDPRPEAPGTVTGDIDVTTDPPRR